MVNGADRHEQANSDCGGRPCRGVATLNRRDFCTAFGKGGLLIASGCSGGKKSNRSGPPNIVLIVMDTVRAANCSGWGYGRQTSAHLDAFMGGATQYRRAYATSSWTLPSHASMFTGLHPCDHEVHAFKRRSSAGTESIYEPALSDVVKTLAEELKERDYATAGFVANTAYLRRGFKLDQGFDTYHVKRLAGVDVAKPALSWMKEVMSKPFFLFLNFMDAHRPYNTEYVRGVMEGSVSEDRELIGSFFRAVMPSGQPLDRGLQGEVTRQYDMGIANADRAVGLVVERLQYLGLFDNTLIIITSDHGEFLGEHDLVEHSKDLYEEALHVPLAVKQPSQRERHLVREAVSIAQIHPTVLAAVGVDSDGPYPPLSVTGGSSSPVVAELYYTREWDFANALWGHRFNRVRSALYDGPWKLIHSTDGDHALYHVEDDPHEEKNVFAFHPSRTEAMLARLSQIKSLDIGNSTMSVVRETPSTTEEDREELRALGYL